MINWKGLEGLCNGYAADDRTLMLQMIVLSKSKQRIDAVSLSASFMDLGHFD